MTNSIAYHFMGEGLKRKKGMYSFFLLEPFPYTIPRSVIERPDRGMASNLKLFFEGSVSSACPVGAVHRTGVRDT